MPPLALDLNNSNLDCSIWPMRITEQTRYALRIIAVCAQKYPERVKVGDLSKITGISPYNIFKLLKIVTRAGYLDSVRGPKGGIMMVQSPQSLTVGQVVRALEPRFQSCAPADLMMAAAPPHQDDIAQKVNEAIGRGINAFLAELDEILVSKLASNS